VISLVKDEKEYENTFYCFFCGNVLNYVKYKTWYCATCKKPFLNSKNGFKERTVGEI